MTRLYVNNYSTTTTAVLSATATVLNVKSAAALPSLTGDEYIFLTLSEGAGQNKKTEIVRVTDVSGNVLTIERAQDDTTAAAFSSGVLVECRATASSFVPNISDAIDDINDARDAGIVLVNSAADSAVSDVNAAASDAEDDIDRIIADLEEMGTGVTKRAIEYATLADALADTDALIYEAFSVENYSNQCKSGVLFFRWVGNGTGTADGGSYIDHDTLSLQAEQNFPNEINIKQFGAVADGSDQSAALRAACAYCDSIGRTELVVDEEYEAPTFEHNEYVNVRFVGDGEVNGVYRRRVIPKMAQSPFVAPNHEEANLKQLNSTSNPVVVLVGDSVSTYKANTRYRGGMLTTSLEQELRTQFGNDLEFHNRAIGGAHYKHLDDFPLSFPEWYTDTLKPWLDYIEELEPDAVVISFGMNDSSTLETSAVQSVIDKLNAFDKPPSIIMCTNLVPSLDGKPTAPDSETRASIEGRDFAAGYTRTFAQYNNYMLLDFNRLDSMCRDGFDVVYGAIGRRDVGLTPTSSGFNKSITGSDDVYNFAVSVDINENEFIASSSYIHVFYGTGSFDYVEMMNIGGFYRFRFRSGSDVVSIDHVFTSSVAVGSNSDRTFVFEKYGNFLTIYDPSVNLGEATAPIIARKIKHCGGLFKPTVKSDLDDSLLSATMSYDSPTRYLQTVTDFDLWGDDNESFGEYSGSGFNHPSTFAATHIYNPILNETQFNHPRFRKSSGESLLITLSDLIYSTNSIENNSSGVGLGSQGFIKLNSSTASTANFSVRETITFNKIKLNYISDSSAGTDILFGMYAVDYADGVSPANTTVKASTETMSVDSSNKTSKVIINPVGGSSTISAGGELVLYRNGNNASDTYGDLKLLSIELVSV